MTLDEGLKNGAWLVLCLRPSMRWCVVSLLMLTPALAAADPSADAFVADVLAHNPDVLGLAERRDAYTAEARAAAYWSDPTLTVMADYLPSTNDRSPMPMLRYQLTQAVPWPGKIGFMQEALEHSARGVNASLAERKLELRFRSKQAFFMLVTNRQERTINRAQRDIAATITAAALGRYSAGAGGHHEVARAEVDVQMLDFELASLDNERTSMIAMLDALRNAPPNTPIGEPIAPIWTATLVLDEGRCSEVAMANRPELHRMDAMRDEARAMGKLARRQPYPDFMVGAWANQMLAEVPPSFGGMVGITLPIFSGPKAHWEGVAYDDRASAAEHEAQAMRAMIRAEVTTAIARFNTTSRQVDLLTGVILPKAHESFDASLAGYGAGTLQITGLLEARRALQNTELALARARALREVAYAEVERAMGAP